jgi:hypothetical protein
LVARTLDAAARDRGIEPGTAEAGAEAQQEPSLRTGPEVGPRANASLGA